MKTTIKTADNGRVIVEPLPGSAVQLTIDLRNASRFGYSDFATVELTPDQIGALLFGIEQAAEAAQVAQDRAKATA